MGIIKIYHDKKWIIQFLDALYNSIDIYDKRFLCPTDFFFFFAFLSGSQISIDVLVMLTGQVWLGSD
jgi:hypothetical protein